MRNKKVELISFRMLLAPKNSCTTFTTSFITTYQYMWKKKVGNPLGPGDLSADKEKRASQTSKVEGIAQSNLLWWGWMIWGMHATMSSWSTLESKGSQDKREEKKDTTSAKMSLSLVSRSCPFFIPEILLLALCLRVVRWKKFVFWSPSLSQLSLDHCLQNFSSLLIILYNFERMDSSTSLFNSSYPSS